MILVLFCYLYFKNGYTNLNMKYRIGNEVAFLFYDAVIYFYSLSYGNCEQENRTENERV